MDSETSVKTFCKNKYLYSGTCCVVLRAGVRDHMLQVVPGHTAEVPSECGSAPKLCIPEDHHLPSKAIPQVKDRIWDTQIDSWEAEIWFHANNLTDKKKGKQENTRDRKFFTSHCQLYSDSSGNFAFPGGFTRSLVLLYV